MRGAVRRFRVRPDQCADLWKAEPVRRICGGIGHRDAGPYRQQPLGHRPARQRAPGRRPAGAVPGRKRAGARHRRRRNRAARYPRRPRRRVRHAFPRPLDDRLHGSDLRPRSLLSDHGRLHEPARQRRRAVDGQHRQPVFLRPAPGQFAALLDQAMARCQPAPHPWPGRGAPARRRQAFPAVGGGAVRAGTVAGGAGPRAPPCLPGRGDA